MAAGGKGNLERIRRGFRTALFMLTMVASLLVLSAPLLLAVGDVFVSLVLASRYACATCYGLREHLRKYDFGSSLMDIPVISVVRSLVITCAYCMCDGPGLSHGPYLESATVCSFISVVILLVKSCLYSPALEEIHASDSLPSEKLHSNKSWGTSSLFLSSLVFALGHVVVAYRTRCKARKKLLFHHVDPESVLACKNVFAGYHKVPRSPTPCNARNSKSNSETKRKTSFHNMHDIPISLLADVDSQFIACQGITVHYKLSLPESPLPLSLSSSPFLEWSPNVSPPRISSGRFNIEWPMIVPPKSHYHLQRSLSNHFQNSSLYAPLLADAVPAATYCADQIPALNLDDGDAYGYLPNSVSLDIDVNKKDKFAVILIHGFGGGVFSWRHLMDVLARQIGCAVVAFDRPGWGLTSRPRRKDWEEKQLPNPYKLESQVDLLISFCLEMGFSSVVLVGHDDGGLLALKAAEKLRSSLEYAHVEVKGAILLSASLSREVIPAFARILLHTSLGKKHMVRPLLRAEITQVINRHAWYDSTKLTAEVMNLYKATLCVEGWDEALHEIGRLSFATVLSPENADALLKSIENLPVLIVVGAEDALVSLKSAQVMASKLLNSRLVAISGCGHLPHEECPKALLAALQPFITRLLPSSDDTLQKQ
ncbi:Prolyl aminopeptidase protein [Dioscorea alata]|uniref:Prolyl aminopeptidase protein n=1 Tax=Dioscorea alata TaxID=55571 RepID=A0ACB7TW50_DIOAL|nr:Prolyl aminopeptidase protein [Dioscorea alata]